jgi:hypothetical protein
MTTSKNSTVSADVIFTEQIIYREAEVPEASWDFQVLEILALKG